MQGDPGLYQLHLLARQIAIEKVAGRNLDHCLELRVPNVDMGKMVLLCIQNVHRYQNPVEHADGRHRSGPKNLLKYVVKARLPVRQFEAEGVAELAGVEPGVGRAFGGRGVVGGGDGLDGFRLHLERLAGLGGLSDDVAGVVAPVGFAAGNAMIGAVGESALAFALPLANELGGNIGEQRGRGGHPPLVGDDAQAVAIGGEFEHGLGEVAAMRADDPAGTQDQVPRIGGLQCQFAVALGQAVDALRVRGIVFDVGALLGAVEDVIGGVMDNEGAEPGGFFAKNARCDGVHRGSTFLIALGLVDGGVGGRVDDDVGANVTHQPANGLRIGQIAFRLVDRNDFAERRQAALEFEADLAVLAGEEEFHLNPRTACRPNFCKRR